MLFNSHIFIFVFLPLVLLGFWGASKVPRIEWRQGWLLLCSFGFYGYWSWEYMLLLGGSIVCNYILAKAITNLEKRRHKYVLTFAVVLNLLPVAYYKYTDFFLENLGLIIGQEFQAVHLLLPLGISFFTFQQIAFLFDVRAGKTRVPPFLRYALFIAFFPQLVSGPIVHYSQVARQIISRRRLRFSSDNLAKGGSLFLMGLAKKVIIADFLALHTDPVFMLADSGAVISLADSWMAVLGFTLQLYFDFSGYSDMAIGLGMMFGVILPINFNSPYKSTSTIEYWRRWHITLAHFMRDYIYIPLGGNRCSTPRRFFNITATLVCAGVWHQASWPFILWGLVNSFYLIVNVSWRNLTKDNEFVKQSKLLYVFFVVVNFVFMRITLILFGVGTLTGAAGLLAGMFDFTNTAPLSAQHQMLFAIIGLGLIWIFFLPNTMQVFRLVDTEGFFQKIYQFFIWKRQLAWAIATSLLLSASVMLLQDESVFIYYKF